METISVVISAWNEEAKIKRCLESVHWADEIIVVDNCSTDATARVAKRNKAKVFSRPNDPMLNVNKNFGFDQATGDWILSLDADEIIPAPLATEIKDCVGHTTCVGFWIARKNILFGKWIRHGLWWPDKQLRLFRRGKGRFPCVHVHEYLEVDGISGLLQEPYIHHNYENISQFIRKMDTLYTESEVLKLLRTNYQLEWYDALRFPLSDFVKVYFAQSGYKDGLHGLILALLQSFYSFVVFAKVWEKKRCADLEISLDQVSAEFLNNKRDIFYWLLTAKIKESRFIGKKLMLKLRRWYANKQ
ncbi:glycosyltransferase family 2 protein [Candidatus Gottesmanbacteria bacterium]|nr:glycosyltransferase family 2 protein [Candidatus Gottesmanbacteria bacterium]